jgi:hypothetical protein
VPVGRLFDPLVVRRGAPSKQWITPHPQRCRGAKRPRQRLKSAAAPLAVRWIALLAPHYSIAYYSLQKVSSHFIIMFFNTIIDYFDYFI